MKIKWATTESNLESEMIRLFANLISVLLTPFVDDFSPKARIKEIKQLLSQ
jgi:hypothetical protein